MLEEMAALRSDCQDAAGTINLSGVSTQAPGFANSDVRSQISKRTTSYPADLMRDNAEPKIIRSDS